VNSLPLIILGAGGHAAVVADALLASGRQVLGFTEADSAKHGRLLCNLPVLGGDEVLSGYAPAAVALANGIGGVRTDATRSAVQARLQSRGWRFASVRHPSCIVSAFAQIGEGSQLLAGCVVQAGARIGAGAIVNTAAVIEHDTVLEEFVHVAPGALLCGGVTVGACSHVGAGAIVRQGLHLGPRTMVAAGAVVIADFQGEGTLLGLPARSIGQQP
jgi:sugar O-acyltransferase (sialic acid O-acetyltransferase NeuD family)